MALNAPLSKLPLIVRQLRSRGIPWVAERLRREWALPTTALGRFAYRARHPERLLRGRISRPGSQEDCLFAFYDLAIAPLTFDFLWFLVGADLERRRAGLKSVHVVIVPGLENGVRHEPADYEALIDSTARHARITNILLPACDFLPELANVTVARSRGEADAMVLGAPDRVFPRAYEPALPSYPGPSACLEAGRQGERIGVLRAPSQDVADAAAWLAERSGGRLPVTITLRQYDYGPARNSNIPAWVAFAKRLPDRFLPVFIPDTDHALEPVPAMLAQFPVCSEAARNLRFRIGIYEAAYANLGINNGPMGLCWLNERTRYLTLKILTESVPQTTAEYMRYLRFDIGRSLPFAKAWQKWVWEDDSLDVIEREFTALVQAIDSGGVSSPGRDAVSV